MHYEGKSPWPRAGNGAGGLSQDSLLRDGLRAAPRRDRRPWGVGWETGSSSPQLRFLVWKAASRRMWRARFGEAQPSVVP